MSPLCIRNQLLVLAFAAFLPSCTIAAVASSENRQARWLFGSRVTVTETSTVLHSTKGYTASSCYVMASDLPVCKVMRRRRDIKIDATPTMPILSTTAPVLEDIGNDNALGAISSQRESRQHVDGFLVANPLLDPSNDNQDIQYPIYGITPGSDEVSRYSRQAHSAPDTSAPSTNGSNSTVKVDQPSNHTGMTTGWLEYFHLKALTTTVLLTTTKTDLFVDPNHMVTFSVRGCSPTVMPFQMAQCSAIPPSPDLGLKLATDVTIEQSTPSDSGTNSTSKPNVSQ